MIEIFKFESETGREPPKYSGTVGIQSMSKYCVSLNELPKDGLVPRRGHDGKLWFRISCEIRCKFTSAGLECAMFYNGQSYGMAAVNYED